MLDKNLLVVKSNTLIEAFTDMTQNECKIVAYLISKIKPDDTEFLTQSITVNELNELLDIKGTKSHTYIKLYSDALLKKKITIRYDNMDWRELVWFDEISYINSESTLNLCFNSKLKNELLYLRNNYTKYILKNICNLNSSYSIRIYELLKQYEYVGYRILSIIELKAILGIKKKYDLYADFKKRVLEISKKELKNHTDIYFEFEEIKKGRRVDSIKFNIFKNDTEDASPAPDETLIVEENNIKEYQNIQKVISDFSSLYNGKLDYNLTKNLVKLKGIDCVKTCLGEFKNFVDTANKVENTFYDFTKKYGTSEAYIKGTRYKNMEGNKPIQATNYEQREYDDEFFDSLYVNLDAYQKD